jgi:hypothetical protein
LKEFVEFTGESGFVYGGTYNKGMTQAYNAVLRCFLITDKARILYFILKSYAYSEEEFPGNEGLKALLGWGSNSTISEYLTELEGKGLIEISRKGNNTSSYRIEEVHKVPCIRHSEYVHSVITDTSLIMKYMKSCLCKDIEVAGYTEEYNNNIYLYLNTSSEEVPTITNKVENRRLSMVKQVANISTSGIENVKDVGKHKKRTMDLTTTDIKDWNSKHLCKYFYDELYNLKKVLPVKDPKAIYKMATLQKARNNNAFIKELIDIYLKNEANIFDTPNLGHYTSTYVQGILESVALTGEYPKHALSNNRKIKGSDMGDSIDAEMQELMNKRVE